MITEATIKKNELKDIVCATLQLQKRNEENRGFVPDYFIKAVAETYNLTVEITYQIRDTIQAEFKIDKS